MNITALRATGFRNLEGRVPLCSPLAVLVGENNAGKSNVIDALRALFVPEAGPQARRWIGVDDFRHDPQGARATDTLEIAAEFSGLTAEDQARMVTCLAPSMGPGMARLRLRAHMRADERIDVEWFGGDSEHPDVERFAREAVTYTYLHPLRDAAADLRPGRGNRLVGLLKAMAPEGHADRRHIEAIITSANAALDAVPALDIAKSSIQSRLSEMAGGGPFVQRTSLVFSDPQFERIVSTLRAMAGAIEPLELNENGLGYNNLLYMAVLLAALSDTGEQALRLLLVEEPEAHLHPQLQDLLMRYLERESGGHTQVVVTSHSPNFASAARVERATVMVRMPNAETVAARSPAEFGLTDKQLAYLRRFLDVTKAGLLFARGVVLVEGVAEQLLVPAIARRLGRPLPNDGVAVINVGGVSFEPFIELFSDDRLPYRCAVVSDGDPPAAPDPAELEGGDLGLSPVAQALLAKQNPKVQVFLSTRTLEWDLARAGNWEPLITALRPIKPRVADGLEQELAEVTDEDRAGRIQDKVRDVKGRFAQELAALLDSEDQGDFTMPEYLQQAIEWVTTPPEP